MPYIENLRSRPQAQMTISLIQKTFLVLRPFEGALICSILIAGTQVMFRKAYFLRRGSWLRPESWTPRPLIQNSGQTNGLMSKISALYYRRMDDITISVEPIFKKCALKIGHNICRNFLFFWCC
jgi:hypothetical protein